MAYRFSRPTFGSSDKPVLRRNFLRKTATLDFPSIAAGGTATLTVTVTGAAVGDLAVVGSGQAAGHSNSLIIFSAYVSTADTVTVKAANPTAAAVDLSSAPYVVAVIKP